MHEIRIMLTTHREEFEERIVENLPLLIFVSNHWNINFAEILREQEDQTDRAVGKQKTGQNVSLAVDSPKAQPSYSYLCLRIASIHQLWGGQSKWKHVILYSRCAYMILIILQVLGKRPSEHCKILYSVSYLWMAFHAVQKTLHTMHEILFKTNFSVMVHGILVGNSAVWWTLKKLLKMIKAYIKAYFILEKRMSSLLHVSAPLY